jgi:hypothetical protein
MNGLQGMRHEALVQCFRSLPQLKFSSSTTSLGKERTTCDPTWRPIIVYIATIFAVFKDYPCRKRGDGASMDGESRGVERWWLLRLRGALFGREDGVLAVCGRSYVAGAAQHSHND